MSWSSATSATASRTLATLTRSSSWISSWKTGSLAKNMAHSWDSKDSGLMYWTVSWCFHGNNSSMAYFTENQCWLGIATLEIQYPHPLSQRQMIWQHTKTALMTVFGTFLRDGPPFVQLARRIQDLQEAVSSLLLRDENAIDGYRANLFW